MDDYLCNPEFTVPKTGLKLLCQFLLIFTIHCITEMISTHSGMSGNLRDDVSCFLSPLRPKVFGVEGYKNNLYLERSALLIPLQKVYLFPNLVAVAALN